MDIRALYYILMGQKALEIDLKDRAMELFDKSSKNQKRWPQAEIHLAVLSEENMNFEEALRHVEVALGIDPKNYEAIELRARYLLAKGDRAGARRDYRTLLTLHPEKSSTLYGLLGDLARAEERWMEAIEHYRMAANDEKNVNLREQLEETIHELELVPELQVLARQDVNYSRKFQALRRISRMPNAAGVQALFKALDDPNIRFARVVWKKLKKVTGEDIEFSKEAWETWWESKGATAAIKNL